MSEALAKPSEMVERVMLALREEAQRHGEPMEAGHPLWAASARAAIEAMRQWPEPMIRALNSYAQCAGYIEEGISHAIDAALSSTGERG